MKKIAVSVDAPLYQDLAEYARRHKTTISEVICQAIEDFRLRHIRPRTSLRDIRPASVGRIIKPFTGSGDVLEELTEGH